MKRVVLVGRGRTVERYRRLYERNGSYAVTISPLDSALTGSCDLIHIVDAKTLSVPDLATRLGPAATPVVLPFSPTIPVATYEATVVALEAQGRRLMLGYAPMYAAPFNKMIHAVGTGIVGAVAGLTLKLPGGLSEFRTQVLAGTSMSPACVGLAYALWLQKETLTWDPVPSDAQRGTGLFGGATPFTVDRTPDGGIPTLVVNGDASELQLAATGNSQVLTAHRGDVERELSRHDDLDVMCAAVKAAGLFLDNRTRTVVPGHAGLALLQAFVSTGKALDPPVTPDPPPPPKTGPIASQPPRYDLYQKLPVRLGGQGRQTPLWEAKFNIESVCNQNCLFCFARDGDLRLTGLEQAPALFGRLSSDGVEGVMFSGREPTLNKRLPDYVARARAAGMKNVTVETNALLFADETMVAACRSAGLNAAFVSFHSVRAETVERLTRTKDSFERTLQGIKNLLANGIEVELNCVVNRYNYQELEEVAHFIAQELASVTSVTFSFIAPLGQAEENKHLVPPISEAAPYLKSALLACERAGIVALVPGRCGIPFCFLPGLERFFVDYQLKDEAPDNGLASDRVKNAECDNCRFNALCHGLWAPYARLYGTDEILDGFWRVNRPGSDDNHG